MGKGMLSFPKLAQHLTIWMRLNYEFYNLYSWEIGFGIRLAKSRLNVQRTRGMQEIVCASSCSGVGVNEKRQRGRPTTGRDKAPYEQQLKRSRFCMIYREQGHKCTTCPKRGDLPRASRKSPKCTNCGVVGHRCNSCGTKKPGHLSQTSSRVSEFATCSM